MTLTVLKGGQIDDKKCTFVSGKVTNTRLMGVLGLFLQYEKKTDDGIVNCQYVFYYDIEEIGLDSIKLYRLDTKLAIDTAMMSAFGGLGAKYIDVTEKESEYLVDQFVKCTKEKHQELPFNLDEVDFILRKHTALSEEEKQILNKKMCEENLPDLAIVNYYLMRSFGKDKEGVDLLKVPDAKEENFEDLSLPCHATFLKNKIEDFVDDNGHFSYLTESLVESGNSHYIVTSEIELENGRVSLAKRKSKMKISLREASLLLSKAEYVAVYEVLCPMDTFDEDFDLYSIGFSRSEHDTGDMFMQFKEDNNHAHKREFNLSDDIKGVYYSTDYGQLIVGASNIDDIIDIEKALQSSSMAARLRPTGKYQFMQSVVFEFAMSGFTDFAQFIDSMGN